MFVKITIPQFNMQIPTILRNEFFIISCHERNINFISELIKKFKYRPMNILLSPQMTKELVN